MAVQKIFVGCLMAVLALSGCEKKATMITSFDTPLTLGAELEGDSVKQFELINGNGMKAVILEYGGILHELHVPDKDGNMADVVLGCSSVESYGTDSPYFGAITGRYANRIAKGKFTLEGKEYSLAINNDPNSLHGGEVGFNKKVWKGETFTNNDKSIGVKLTYTSPDMEEGFPGAMTTTVTYTLTHDNTLDILFEATTDKTTVVNLTHHAYFNLAGHDSGKDVLGHELQIEAANYTPFDSTLIPTGAIEELNGSPLDFSKSKAIGKDIADVEGGYDHNYVLDNQSGKFALAARVVEPNSGRVMEVHSDQPGIQFYTGNGLDGSFAGKSGVKYTTQQGFCLEPQVHPDTPNNEDFPTSVLKPGETYRHHMSFAFSNK
jgi:aldose 1-epimerase